MNVHFCFCIYLNPNLPLNPKHIDASGRLGTGSCTENGKTVKAESFLNQYPIIYRFYNTIDMCSKDVGNTDPSLAQKVLREYISKSSTFKYALALYEQACHLNHHSPDLHRKAHSDHYGFQRLH